MATINDRLAVYRSYIPPVKPWVAAAVIVAVALGAYFAALGARYVGASAEAERAGAEVRNADRALAAATVRRDRAHSAVAAGDEARVQELIRVFEYPVRDDLIGVVSDIATASRVMLGSISMGDRQTLVEDDVQYTLQPMNIAVEGSLTDLDGFLARLQERVPVVKVSTVSMSGGGDEGVPAMNLQMTFRVSPAVAVEQPAAPAKSQGKK